MSRRLLSFLLAVAVAFVFTGRMEAAASHCRGLTEAMEMTANTADMAAMPGMADCPGMGHPAPGHSPTKDPCECLAMLMADCPVVETARVFVRIAPFDWRRPAAVSFASLEPVPDSPPPRG